MSPQTHAQSEEYTELSLSELSELSLVSDSASHGSALINMPSFKAACVLSVHCQSWGLVTMSNVKCQMQHYHHGWVYCSNSVDEASRQASARAHANKNVCDCPNHKHPCTQHPTAFRSTAWGNQSLLPISFFAAALLGFLVRSSVDRCTH